MAEQVEERVYTILGHTVHKDVWKWMKEQELFYELLKREVKHLKAKLKHMKAKLKKNEYINPAVQRKLSSPREVVEKWEE